MRGSLIFGYVVEDSTGTPATTLTYYEENLNFFEKDSISGLPGAVYENGSYVFQTMISFPRLVNGAISSRVFDLRLKIKFHSEFPRFHQLALIPCSGHGLIQIVPLWIVLPYLAFYFLYCQNYPTPMSQAI